MLSIPIIARNVVKLCYPLDRVVKSVAGLADEIVIAVDPTSEDDTLDYVYDLSLEINASSGKQGTVIRTIHSKWNLDNISSNGAEFSRQTNISFEACKGDFILQLQCDEAVHELDRPKIRSLIENADKNGIDAYSMTRIYFYGDINTVRDDWTVPIVRLFRKGTRSSSGDAMNTSGSDKVVDCDVPIYHYSRIGDPELISKRILSLDKLFHDKEKLLDEEDLKPYDFKTRNFDCMHREGIDVGKVSVGSCFSTFTGSHPKPFTNYRG
jgi:hypothetical protein